METKLTQNHNTLDGGIAMELCKTHNHYARHIQQNKRLRCAILYSSYVYDHLIGRFLIERTVFLDYINRKANLQDSPAFRRLKGNVK